MSELLTLTLAEAQGRAGGFRPTLRGGAGEGRAVAVQPPMIDAFAEGFDEGQRTAAALFDEERAAFNALVANATALQPEPSEELALLIATTVERLVTQIVGEAAIDHAMIERRARAAAALIGDADAARTMRVAPRDFDLLQGAELPLPLLADPALARGDIRIDCSQGWIEHGNALYLDALRAELGMGAGA